jgi:hypothetical protein
MLTALNKKYVGGVLIAVSKSLYGIKQRYDLEICVWVEIPVRDN